MATKPPKGLGRGLEALLGPSVDAPTFGAESAPSQLPLSDIVAGAYQPRTRMDEGALYELAESIKAQGVMQPILVRPLRRSGDAATSATRYEIIAGERRFRAAGLAGLDRVPVLVRDVDDRTAAAMALIENIQREDLNPLEEAQGLQRLVQEFGMTHEAAAGAVGRSRSAASNLLRLLQLAEPVQTMLLAGDLDMGHARALLALDLATQLSAAQQISAKKLSVREAEALVKKLLAEFALEPTRHRAEKPAHVQRIEKDLSDWLSTPVEVRLRKRGKDKQGAGEIGIRFASMEALDAVLARLRAP
ncbi:ParB/RepB/Spo0J family partition protein [Candidatus Symbiobacter mobilis]|uniref:ParB family chromosome partitioning protein n=1 Tax=Candidatus Symbiobacter mobilis CR TaxID=946483 RepID=U5NDK5_9BURK|nr:ParB/RepB/Spo0J family partition protein [Candidatus Symbiobacter mobilis]AGX88249.1 ParB family chromosome partitioning protein [Candidatus Symbiobacter mobilis CR]